jgi:uncharacterized protein (DUF924 family)
VGEKRGEEEREEEMTESVSKEEVLEFWFETLESKDWFMGGDRVDEMLKSRFSGLMEEVTLGKCDGWSETLEGRLALILVCDQFSRNIFRGTERAFSYDEKARVLVHEVLSSAKGQGYLLGEARVLETHHQLFFFMPLIHSELLSDQELSLKVFGSLGIESSLKEARNHYDLIERFGRYPHRNEVLGRESTKEEEAYLSHPSTNRYGVEKK